MVSISFVLAVTLWFLVAVNTQSYSYYFDVPVKLTNFPDSYQLTSDFPREIHVLTKGVGIKLLYQSFSSNTDTVYIDFEDYAEDERFVSNSAEAYQLVRSALQTGVEPVRVYPEVISLAFLRKTNKRVPVVLDVELDLPTSFRVMGELRPKTDSVLVIGPKDSLEKITEWRTVHYKTPKIKRTQDLYIPLDTMAGYQVLPKEVVVPVNPILVTEKIVSVPVRPSYVPKPDEVFVSPDSVRIKVLVPLEEYETVTSDDFRVEVDYRQISTRSNFVLPQIKAFPQEVEIIGMSPQSLEYLVITKRQ